jgi:apolipoprotein N-acyltransferase
MNAASKRSESKREKKFSKESRYRRLRVRIQGINLRTFILALSSGLLLFFSFPKYGAGLIAWVALVPLLFALKDANISGGFILGLITGISGYTGIMYWITHVVVNYGYLPYIVGVLVMMLLVMYLSIYVALFAAGIVHCRSKGIPDVLSAPLLWVCLEFGKSHLLTGFPWENIAYSQYLNTSIIQCADIAGIYGIAFLIVLINVIIHDVITRRTKGVWIEVALACVLLMITYGYGVLRLNQMKEPVRTPASLHLSLIQGNIDQSIKWNPQYQRDTIRTYKTLSLEKASSGAGLIIWPETAVPFFFQDANDMHRDIAGIATISGNWLLIGSPSYLHEENTMVILNSAFLLSPDGKTRAKYDKVHLVPYGEYVPLRQFFPFIKKLVVGVGDFRPGTGFHPLPMNGHRIGVLICYEGIFPEASRLYKERGADLLVNITNDAWFGKTSAPYQHLSMTVFRAVENRVYVARAANTGISAIIDPTGRIVAQTELFEQAALSHMVRLSDHETLYSRYGDVFVCVCMITLLICYAVSLKRRNAYDWRNTRCY